MSKMILIDEATVKLALDALEHPGNIYHIDCPRNTAITALREALAEPILAAISELKTCSTCEALARAVMMDQTSHDRFPPVEENT